MTENAFIPCENADALRVSALSKCRRSTHSQKKQLSIHLLHRMFENADSPYIFQTWCAKQIKILHTLPLLPAQNCGHSSHFSDFPNVNTNTAHVFHTFARKYINSSNLPYSMHESADTPHVFHTLCVRMLTPGTSSALYAWLCVCANAVALFSFTVCAKDTCNPHAFPTFH